MQQSNQTSDKRSSIRLLIVLMTGAVAICIGFSIILISLVDTWDHRGQFGDMFGALNAVFSGLAFAGVIYAIMLQREEMRSSREALSAQHRLLADQLETMREALLFEQKKESLARAPSIRIDRDLAISEGSRKIRLANDGDRITDVQVQLKSPSHINVTPTRLDQWDTGQMEEFEIRGFEGRRCPDCVFLLRFKDKLGSPGEETIPIHGMDPNRFLKGDRA
jgi:hypothetical protein